MRLHSISTMAVCFVAMAGFQVFGQTLDVRNYGAACNGVTDDSRALQNAFDAVQSGGTVNISCMLGVGSSGVRLSNKTGVTVQASVAGAGIRLLGRPSQGVGGFGPFIFAIYNCTDCRIKNLTFDGNGVNAGALGIATSLRTVIEGNTVMRLGGGLTGGGISASGNQDNQYLRNVVDGAGWDPVPQARGMWLGNWDPSETEWNPKVIGNTVRNTPYTGIAMHAVAATITDNTAEGTAGAGIKLVSHQNRIRGTSLIERNTLRRNHFHGLQIDAGIDLIVRDNLMEQNDGSGMYVTNGMDNSTVTNNIMRDNNWDRLDGWAGGIFLHDTTNSVISSNQFYDTRSGTSRTQDNAIVVNTVTQNGVSNLKIQNNSMQNHTENGIAIQNYGSGALSGVEISGNQILNNRVYGIWVYERTAGALRNITLAGTTFSGNGVANVYDNTLQKVIYGSTTTTVTPLSISVTSPAADATVSGTVTLGASVSGGATLQSVQFKINGSNFGAAQTASPSSLAWDTKTVANGRYGISAVARDSAGTTIESAVRYVDVLNQTTTPPSTSGEQAFITNYVEGTLVSGGYVSGWVGMRLQVGASPITVTQLGRYKLSNNSLSHTLKIVNGTTGADVPNSSTQVNLAGQATGSFVYGSLSSPVTLSANTAYLIVSSESVNNQQGDWFHEYNGTLTTTSAAAVTNAVYWNGSGWSGIGSTNKALGPVSFKYTSGGSTTPTTPLSAAVTSPAANAQVSGVINLTASAAGGVSIASVQFKINGNNYGSALTTSPYTASWDTRTMSNGRYSITAEARCTTGAVALSPVVYVDVNNVTTAPVAEQPFVTKYKAGTLVSGGYTGWVGMRIKVGASPITVTQIGRWKLAKNNSLQHTLKIVDGATGADISGSSVQINLAGQPSTQFIYGKLSTPVILKANSFYLIVSSESVNNQAGDWFHEYNGALVTTTAAAVQNAVYYNGSGWTGIGGANQSLGPVSLQYK